MNAWWTEACGDAALCWSSTVKRTPVELTTDVYFLFLKSNKLWEPLNIRPAAKTFKNKQHKQTNNLHQQNTDRMNRDASFSRSPRVQTLSATWIIRIKRHTWICRISSSCCFLRSETTAWCSETHKHLKKPQCLMWKYSRACAGEISTNSKHDDGQKNKTPSITLISCFRYPESFIIIGMKQIRWFGWGQMRFTFVKEEMTGCLWSEMGRC